MFFVCSCHYHYGPEENLNGENSDGSIRHKAYVKNSDAKKRSIEEIETDIVTLKTNMDLVTDNLNKSDKVHAEQLILLKGEVQQLKMDYNDEITKMYWIIGGVTVLLISAAFFGVYTYVEKRIREGKVSGLIS